ncbi:MAG: hypothetical protein ACOVQT_17705 [Rubrivivax sp.]
MTVALDSLPNASPQAASLTAPGRSCPLHYRYAPEVFRSEAPSSLQGLEVLYVVGGLYGNALALDQVLSLFAREGGRKALVFNGDFHWFDAHPAVFDRVQQGVLAHTALRGNVETELAEEDPDIDAGCGCAYPEWVGDGVVERSNRILARLRQATTPPQRQALRTLPPWLRADVGPLRLGLVHGDATSLAGWGFAQEHLQSPAHRAEVAGWIDRAGVDAFACTHTCLPVFQALRTPQRNAAGQGAAWVLNNGAAGMPNFRGDAAGLVTRIGLAPCALPDVRFAVPLGRGVVAEALALNIDPVAAREAFRAQWPAGSDADLSYFDRIVHGPSYDVAQAVRKLE